jgi:2-polyprenyl-6-hydroxyphenyl methylase/3-demethylubiquinone-9 3-methyltransferase
VVAEHLMKIVPKGTHQHLKFIKPSELAHMARSAGLVIQDSSGIDFNPILNHYALSSSMEINYLMAFRKET